MFWLLILCFYVMSESANLFVSACIYLFLLFFHCLFSFCLSYSILICLFSFNCKIFYYYPLDAHLFSKKRQKGVDAIGMVGTSRSKGREKHNQYILYVERPISNKENIFCV